MLSYIFHMHATLSGILTSSSFASWFSRKVEKVIVEIISVKLFGITEV